MTTMMTTQAGGAGAFDRFDLSRVPSPCFVVDEVAVERNLAILEQIGTASGAQIFAALKAFSMFALAPLTMRYLQGTCASGIFEARLARTEYGGQVATFCAGYKAQDIEQVIELSDHVIFNSLEQAQRFGPQCHGQNVHVGLRINPLHQEGEIPKYDPCAPGSRLGVPIDQIARHDLAEIDGFHFHTLCEQGFEPLLRTWRVIEQRLGADVLEAMKWINLGGGHHITRADYDRDGLVGLLQEIRAKYKADVILEPGEAVALDAGILVGEVVDTLTNDGAIAIVDISATCHMPDVIEAPYRPALLGEAAKGRTYRLGGPSCLAGDVIGEYSFAGPLQIGDRFAFLDQAHYSMVKTNTFNGVPLPAIALWNSQSDDLRIVRSFGYDDFKSRLS